MSRHTVLRHDIENYCQMRKVVWATWFHSGMIGFSQKIWINHTTLPRGSAELSDTCHAAITSKRVARCKAQCAVENSTHRHFQLSWTESEFPLSIKQQTTVHNRQWRLSRTYELSPIFCRPWSLVICACSRFNAKLNPLITTLKPQSNGPSYSNTVIGTLAVDEWAVTFGTARRWLGGAPCSSSRPLLGVQNVTAHPSTASVPTSYYLM